MSNTKNKFIKFIVTIFCLCFAFTAFAANETAQEKLETGKQLYGEGKYDQAMDNFIDVFVQGNNEQIAEANQYVNLIHSSMGDVTAPKQVPYDPSLEPKDDGHKGKIMSTEYNPGQQEAAAAASAPEKKPVNTQAKDTYIYKETPAQAPVAAAPAPVAQAPAAAVNAQQKPKEQIIVEDTLPSGDPQRLKELRKEQIDQQVASMTGTIIGKLKKIKGINVYMRGGLIDAIDIDSDLLFMPDKITYTDQAKDILDNVYSLMVLSGTPSFILLPPGSYTDDVSIQGVRQAVALNSYLINMGVSTAKLSFNMGLTSEQPPAKFSNLEGISIVFDYTATPNLKLKMSPKNTLPVLSLGLYPFDSFKPQNNEGMLVDFSVVQSSYPVADWKLQLVQHANNGKYYVVRQISGNGPAYHQMFWNGRKQYFGQVLPFGVYTVILRAKDVMGREKVVRRKVVLLGKNQAKPVMGSEKTPVQGKPKAILNDASLNYKTPRLWKKPSRKAGPGAKEESAKGTVNTLSVTNENPQPAETASATPQAAVPTAVTPAATATPAADNQAAPAADSAAQAQPASSYGLDANDPLISSKDYNSPATAAPAKAKAKAKTKAKAKAKTSAAPKTVKAAPAVAASAAPAYPAQQPQEGSEDDGIANY